MKKAIATKKAPGAIGPYTQGVEAGGFVYVSGQIPLDPKTGAFAGATIAEQTTQSLKNVEAILAEAGCTMADVVKTTVLLASMEDFGAMNDVYGTFFEPPYPARAAFAAKALPKGALVEIEAIAYKGEKKR